MKVRGKNSKPKQGMRKDKNPPKKGRKYEVVIESKGKKGDGVAFIRGFPVIVPGSKVGEEIRIKITNTNEKYAFGKRCSRSSSKTSTPISSNSRSYKIGLNGAPKKKSPWSGGSGNPYYSKGGGEVGKCKKCGGKLIRDPKHKETYCNKCGNIL